MIYLNKQLLQSCFLNIGYSPLDYLYVDQVEKAINELNQEQFDKQTLDEMMNQCKNNSKGQIKVQDLIMTFVKAQTILIQREIELKNVVNKLQTDIKEKKLMASNLQNNNQLQKLEEQLHQVKQQRISNNINIQIVRKPFINKRNLLSNNPLSAAASPQRYQSIQRQQQINLPGEGLFVIANTQTFTWIFQLTCLLLVLSIPCMLYYNNFMNLILFSLIFLNFVVGYFCRNILRKWMYFTVISIIVDAIWFIVGVKPFWNTSYIDWPHSVNPYLRLSVIIYGVVCIGKVVLVILFVSEYNTDQSQKKKVSVFGFFDIQLSHDQISKSMFAVLNKTAHHHYAQDAS